MKDLRISGLLDLYGKLLTDKQLSIMEQYYHFDCSLAEIAEVEGVTRQAVHASLRQAQNAMFEWEQKLGLYAKLRHMRTEIEKAKGITEISELQDTLNKISELI